MSTLPLRTFDYAQVDVFAERPLEGNALAVFTDARGLSSAEMQAIARETNLSETTFILPRDAETEARHGVQVRIFTVQEELPFAGHPTLGTASWLYWNHPIFRGAAEITLDLPVGRIPVSFSGNEAGGAGVFATMRQNDPVFGSVHAPEAVAQALGLTVADLDPSVPVQTVSTGMAFCVVPLRSMEAARRLSMPPAASQSYLEDSDAKFFYCITPAPPGGADWHARMQWPAGEDPATGSAAGCAIAYLVRHELAASGQPIVIEQGVEMFRPSRIHVRATLEAGSVSGVFVGGRTIPVGQVDALSFRDSRDFNSPKVGIPNVNGCLAEGPA